MGTLTSIIELKMLSRTNHDGCKMKPAKQDWFLSKLCVICRSYNDTLYTTINQSFRKIRSLYMYIYQKPWPNFLLRRIADIFWPSYFHFAIPPCPRRQSLQVTSLEDQAVVGFRRPAPSTFPHQRPANGSMSAHSLSFLGWHFYQFPDQHLMYNRWSANGCISTRDTGGAEWGVYRPCYCGFRRNGGRAAPRLEVQRSHTPE